MKALRLTACAAFLAGCAHAPLAREDRELESRLAEAARGFRGEVGVYVRHLRTGRSAGLNADAVLPTASLVKVPILAALFDRIDRGEADYNAPLVYRSSMAYAEGDMLASFKDGERLSLARLAHLSAAFSDNTAALWLQDLAGGGAAVNLWLEANGFSRTRVNSRTEGREPQRQLYGWGQTTPREMAELMAMIRRGSAVSPAASGQLLRVLSGSFWDGEALSQVPPYVHAASKQGATSRSRSEAAVVDGPSGGYVFCVITDGQQDTAWERGNEGFELIRRVSRILWEHFEGGRWRPPAGMEKYWKRES